MERAVLTGATGAIGVALIHELIEKNIEVLVLCRKDSRRRQNIPLHPLVRIRYYSLDELADLYNDTDTKYDVFYHFAWEGTMGNSRNDMYLQNRNVQYTLDAVNAAERLGCKVFIGAGSQAEYGRCGSDLNSRTPVFPENGYGIAKLCAGQMSRVICEQKGMKHIWARVLSVYGPFDNAGTMIMSTIGKILHGETPSLTKGEQLWDYIYSQDAAKAFLLLAEHGADGKVYCIGSGKAFPLAYYIECVRNLINPDVNLGMGAIPYQPKQIMYLCADISELTKDTGFVPVYTFDEGIRRTITWYKEHNL